jgi:drug/metabolite transporter (DMT)-like permease
VPSSQPPASLRLRGVLLCLGALFLFSALDATAKHLSAFLAVPLLVWARYLVHLLIMVATVLPRQGRHLVATGRPWLMALRGVTLAGVTLLGQFALYALPLAETTALIFVAPLLVALLAGPLLGEQVGRRTWFATVAGFAGVLLIARPGGSLAAVGVACALAAALCYAAYQILTRKLVASEPPLRLLFHTALFGTLVMSAGRADLLGRSPADRRPGPAGRLAGRSMAASGTFCSSALSAETPASLLSPLLYVQLVWAALLGWLIFDQLPDLLAIFGMLIIGASGLSLALRRQR